MSKAKRVTTKFSYDIIGPFDTLTDITKPQSFATKKEHLSYKDFRPIKKGEMGYSPTARRYISPSSGEIISVAKFQKLAHGNIPYSQRKKVRSIIGGNEKVNLLAQGYINENFKYQEEKNQRGPLYRNLTSLTHFSDLVLSIKSMQSGRIDGGGRQIENGLDKFDKVEAFYVKVWHEKSTN